VTTAGPDLGDKTRCGDPKSEGESSSSSKLSPASAQNRDPRQTWLSGSGERGEGGAPAVAALDFFVAFESPGGRDRPAPTVIFSVLARYGSHVTFRQRMFLENNLTPSGLQIVWI
jgi:hypothetical protein